MKFTRQSLAAVAATAAFAGLAPLAVAPVAEARKVRAPKPTPTPPPTVAPAPTSINWYAIRPDLAQGLSRPATQYVEHQVVAGPGFATPGPIVRSVSGIVDARDLRPASTYSVRVRNIAVGASPSAWTTFTVTTTAEFLKRPPAPTNLRVIGATATTVTVAWDAPPGGPYQYEARAGAILPIPFGPYFFENRERTFVRPAAGTSLTITVAARDANLNLSLPATVLVTG